MYFWDFLTEKLKKLSINSISPTPSLPSYASATDKDHNIFFLISVAIFNPPCVSPFLIFIFLVFCLLNSHFSKSWTEEWDYKKAQATSNSTTTTKVNFFLFLLKWKFLLSLSFPIYLFYALRFPFTIRKFSFYFFFIQTRMRAWSDCW